MWVAKFMHHSDTCIYIAIATEVIQLPHSRQQACFINIDVWLVTLTDKNALASNRPYDHSS